ncbi:hypothetical protein OG372_12885 [Streptomyces sp. NBC_01020]|uniref:hypothetical protein n=1 Tax=Streptomyces sp. NBC_01020 TaxID=2903722 RepID=UPI0038687CD2|nr:hypothetical protein OG372_12885 [Streptomyces sp. NBC_01020]
MTRGVVRTGAFVTAGIFLVVGCSGGGGSDNSNKIKGAEAATHSASPSASASPGGQRPKITFPSYAKNVFEGQQTGDPKKDAVLADNAQRVNSIDDAIFQGKADTPALDFYSTGPAIGSAMAFIKGWVTHRETWVGVTRYFDRKVSFRDDGAAVVIYCSDESKAYIKDEKTGKVDRSPATSDAYVLYNTRLVKSNQGVWRTVDVASKRGASECQP